MEKYCNYLSRSISDTYYLVITGISEFYQDLRNSLSNYEQYNNIRLLAPIKDKEQLIFPNDVQYVDTKENLAHGYDNEWVIFLKSKQYAYQSELRLMLGNFIFNTVPEKTWTPTSLYNPNYLTVSLPNLHKYAVLRKAIDMPTIQIKSMPNENFVTIAL